MMHTYDGKNNNGMMWMMVLCCVLPLLLIGIFGAGGKALGAPTWAVLGVIVVMAVAHLVMMRRSYKHCDEQHKILDGEDGKKTTKDDTTHSGHNCCH